MNLRKWADKQGRGAIRGLEKATGLTYGTVHKAVQQGASSVRSARLLSAATEDANGVPEVSVIEALGLGAGEDSEAAA